MKNFGGLGAALLAAGIGGGTVLYFAAADPVGQGSPNTAHPTSHTASPDSGHWRAGPTGQGILTSPFGVAATNKPDLRHVRADRERRMRSGKYDTPTQYHSMDLRTLHALADKGDVLAMLQLGEQYASEAEALEYDPAFDPKAVPRKVSDYHFQNAIQGGHTHIAAVLAYKNLERGDMVDAFAWNLLSQHYHDQDRTALYDPSRAFAQLSAADRQAGQKRYESLARSMGLR